MRISINMKMLLGYGIVILLMAVLTSQFTFSQFDKVNNLNDRIIDNMLSEYKLIDVLENDFFEMDKSVVRLKLNGNPEMLEDLIRRMEILSLSLDAFKNIYQNPRLSDVLNLTINRLDKYKKVFIDIKENNTDQKVKLSELLNENGLNNLINEIDYKNKIDIIKNYFNQKVNDEKIAISEIRKDSYIYLGLIFLSTVVVALLIGIFSSRNISNEIRMSSNLIRRVSDEISDTTANETEVSETQSQKIEQVSENLQELSASANLIAGSVGDVSEKVNVTAEKMLGLKESAGKIETINVAVNEITQQINILSLNASIEASRAGEQGKGFSAVAMEIRKLAENTRNTTEDVYSIIETIRKASSYTMDAMEEVVKLVGGIKENVNQQDLSTTSITDAVSKINEGMKTTVDSIKKTGDAADELAKLSKKLQKLV